MRPTARELADRVQRYLDGDRDHERAASSPREHLGARARRARVEGSRAARRGDAGARAGARARSRVRRGARLVTGLMVEPPAKLPAELLETLVADDLRFGVQRLRFAAMGLASMFLLLVFAPVLGIRSWFAIGTFYATLAAVIAAFWMLYRAGRTSVVVNLLGMLAMSLAFSRVLGPWIVTPIMIVGGAFAVSANPWLEQRPAVVVGWVWVCLLAPVLLELSGLFAPTYFVGAQGILSISRLLVGTSPADPYALVAAHLIVLAAVTLFAVTNNRVTRSFAARSASRRGTSASCFRRAGSA